MKKILISVISHGHGKYITKLFESLAKITLPKGFSLGFVLTINIPEPDIFLGDFPFHLKIVNNVSPRSFGDNHNQAFNFEECDLFFVVNPDVTITNTHFERFILFCEQNALQSGVIAPLCFNPNGAAEDNFRLYPTPRNLFLRYFGHFIGCDLDEGNKFDWASGLFICISSKNFSLVNGFDTSFFMYVEDTDLCFRLKAKGLDTLKFSEYFIVHDARRESRRNKKYFIWHCASLLRFWWRFYIRGLLPSSFK